MKRKRLEDNDGVLEPNLTSNQIQRCDNSATEPDLTKPKNLYLNRVLLRYTLEDLCKIFKTYGDGEIFECHRNPNDVRPRCVFVSFKNPEDAERVFYAKEELYDIYHFQMSYQSTCSCKNIFDGQAGKTIFFKKDSDDIIKRKTVFTKGKIRTRKVKIKKAAAEPTSEDSPIDILNDDCFDLLLVYLSKRQRISIERVSRKWRERSLQSWAAVKTFDYQKDIKMSANLNHLESLLLRCGNYITTLNMNCYSKDCNAGKIILLIDTYCKNLTRLQFSQLSFKDGDLNLFSNDFAKRLKSLEIKDCSLNDRMLEPFLKKSSTLECLLIHNESSFYGRSLEHLTDNCVSLSLKDIYRHGGSEFTQALLPKILDKIPKATRLEFRGIEVTPEMLLTFMTNLTHLSVEGYNNFFSGGYRELRFPNLKELSLYDVSLNDQTLRFLSGVCPLLENLDISRENVNHGRQANISPENYKLLNKFTGLKCLLLNCASITSDDFIDIAEQSNGRFETLECKYCNNLNCDSLIRMIALSPRLKEFDVSYVSAVSADFLESALQTAAARENNLSLTLYIATWSQAPPNFAAVKHAFQKDHKDSLLQLMFGVRTPRYLFDWP